MSPAAKLSRSPSSPVPPVLLESFAVWCPICTNQQKQVRALHEEVGDEVISIALNTDPNEDHDKVAAHIARHGFDWRYAVAPAELILALKEEFGVGILNAPSAPVVLICGDQSVREMLKRGGEARQLPAAAGRCLRGAGHLTARRPGCSRILPPATCSDLPRR